MNSKEIIVIDAQEVVLETIGNNPFSISSYKTTPLLEGEISEIKISQEKVKEIEHKDWRDRANGLSI